MIHQKLILIKNRNEVRRVNLMQRNSGNWIGEMREKRGEKKGDKKDGKRARSFC